MAEATLGAPREHHVGTEPLQLLREALRHSEDERAIAGVVAELPVGKAQQDRRLHTERLRGASCLLGALPDERLARGAGVRAREEALLPRARDAVADDEHEDAVALACVPCQDRRHGRLVVGVGEDRDQRPGRPARRCSL